MLVLSQHIYNTIYTQLVLVSNANTEEKKFLKGKLKFLFKEGHKHDYLLNMFQNKTNQETKKKTRRT